MAFDGFRLRSHKRAYTGEIVIGSSSDGGRASARQMPCRIIPMYWDDDHESIRIGIRRARTGGIFANGLQPRRPKAPLGEVGSGGEVDVDSGALLDLCEVLSPLLVRRGVHKKPWVHGDCKFEGCTFVGEGFVHKVGGRVPRFETTSGKKWSWTGMYGDNFVDMRKQGMHENTDQLLFAPIYFSFYMDAFRVFSMRNPVRRVLCSWHMAGRRFAALGLSRGKLQIVQRAMLFVF